MSRNRTKKEAGYQNMKDLIGQDMEFLLYSKDYAKYLEGFKQQRELILCF